MKRLPVVSLGSLPIKKTGLYAHVNDRYMTWRITSALVSKLKIGKADGRRWHVAQITVKRSELIFNFGCEWMATITIARGSRQGFKPLNI